MHFVFEIVTEAGAVPWDAFVAAQGGHLLQSWAWGDLKSEFGWQAARLAVQAQSTRYAAAQILLRRGPGFNLAYVPRGPVWRRDHPAALRPLLQAVIEHARRQGAFLVKIEPNETASGQFTDALRASGFTPSRDTVQPRTTLHLDLTRSLDEILAAMKPKWRYNIRLAAKKGILVRAAAPDDLVRIYDLIQITGARDGFGVHTADYYRRAAELLGASDRACWWVATYQAQIIAAIFVTAFGPEAIYLYGASAGEHRDRMPNHALHWAAIQWARARGCVRYDWWGVPDVPEGGAAESDPGAQEKLPEGLYRFKQGFGGQVVRYAGAWDRVLMPVRFRLYTELRHLRRQPA